MLQERLMCGSSIVWSWCTSHTQIAYVMSQQSCAGNCGGFDVSGCSCDYRCFESNNCCENVCSVCGTDPEICTFCRTCAAPGEEPNSLPSVFRSRSTAEESSEGATVVAPSATSPSFGILTFLSTLVTSILSFVLGFVGLLLFGDSDNESIAAATEESNPTGRLRF